MVTIIKGNPYTHSETRRDSIAGSVKDAGHRTDGKAGCDWCGQSRRVYYRYNSREFRWFCNQECASSYWN